MNYRKLKIGEIIESDDEYLSVFSPGRFQRIQDHSVGKTILECNINYYRRPIIIERED